MALETERSAVGGDAAEESRERDTALLLVHVLPRVASHAQRVGAAGIGIHLGERQRARVLNDRIVGELRQHRERPPASGKTEPGASLAYVGPAVGAETVGVGS